MSVALGAIVFAVVVTVALVALVAYAAFRIGIAESNEPRRRSGDLTRWPSFRGWFWIAYLAALGLFVAWVLA